MTCTNPTISSGAASTKHKFFHKLSGILFVYSVPNLGIEILKFLFYLQRSFTPRDLNRASVSLKKLEPYVVCAILR